jgi:hypothetical protein
MKKKLHPINGVFHNHFEVSHHSLCLGIKKENVCSADYNANFPNLKWFIFAKCSAKY